MPTTKVTHSAKICAEETRFVTAACSVLVTKQGANKNRGHNTHVSSFGLDRFTLINPLDDKAISTEHLVQLSDQFIGVLPNFFNASFVCEKCLQPKKCLTDKGDGCAP